MAQFKFVHATLQRCRYYTVRKKTTYVVLYYIYRRVTSRKRTTF